VRRSVWVLDKGRITRVPVQIGLSDGTQTAMLNGGLQPGTQVVTGAVSANAPASTPARSPLLPQGRRGGGGGRL